jgi:hypothetical protein
MKPNEFMKNLVDRFVDKVGRKLSGKRADEPFYLWTWDIINTRSVRVYLAWGMMGFLNVAFCPTQFTQQMSDGEFRTCVNKKWTLHLFANNSRDFSWFQWNYLGYDCLDNEWHFGPLGFVNRINY